MGCDGDGLGDGDLHQPGGLWELWSPPLLTCSAFVPADCKSSGSDVRLPESDVALCLQTLGSDLTLDLSGISYKVGELMMPPS